MARAHGSYPPPGAPWTDEDRLALASERDAFRRGLEAAKRALERQTPLAKGSIAVIDELLNFT